MAAMLGVVRRFLSTERAVTMQLQFYMFILRVYMPTKRQYERQFEEQARHNQPDGRHVHIKNHHHHTRNHPTIKWRFPEFPLIFRLYNIASNVLLSWVFFKYLFPGWFVEPGRLIAHLIGLNSSTEDPNCYVYGRLVLHYEISLEIFGFLMASFHLLWRLIQQSLNRPFDLEVVLFLMQPRENIKRFTKRIESTTCTEDELENNYERFLCHIMCYKVTFVEQNKAHGSSQRVLYRLRSNRTLKARQRLVDSLVDMTISSAMVLTMLTVPIAVYIGIIILFNRYRYMNAYPNCDTQSLRLYHEGHLSRWSLPWLGSRHYMTTVLFDGLENAVVWFESGLILICVLVFSTYLNSDLVTHWTHLNVDIQQLLNKSRQSHHSRWEQDDDLHLNLHRPSQQATTNEQDNQDNNEQQIYYLQAALVDFFHEINKLDLFISDVITFCQLVGISGLGCTTLQSAEVYLESRNTDFAIVGISFNSAVFLGYAWMSISLLSLQQYCRWSYPSLCSLMANDQARYKRHFMRILDFYTSRERTCYTLFQQVPFSSNNFASVIGWSVSCFLIADSVLH